MTDIKLFNSPQFGDIRTVEIEDKVYFVANDVALALGYAYPKDAVTRHCKGATFHRLTDNQGVSRDTKIIQEGDVYRLAAKSELPDAEKFESWIFDEVIPTVRKHGGYLTPQKIEEVLLNPDTIIVLAQRLKDEQIKLKEAEKQISLLKPKVQYLEKVLDADENVDIGQAAKILRLPFGRNTLFKKLREKGVFFKNKNEPKQEYIDRNYFLLKEKWIERDTHDDFLVVKVLVTQKGLSFIDSLFGSMSKGEKKLAKIA